MLQIDKNYRVLREAETMILQFHEMRERKKKDNTTEIYEFTENYYHPTVQSCLVSYLHKKQEEAKDVKDCIRITEETIKTILNLKLIN